MKELSVVTSYDRIAATYAEHIAGELAGKPLDRALLAAFAEQAKAIGPLCDLGCGPGHVAAFLHALGADVVGIDASGGMVAQSQQRFPSLRFRQGDMRALDVPDATWGGIAALYSIIHLEPDEIVPTFHEWRRVLRPGGFALVAFHIGAEVVHRTDMWDQPVDLDFHFLDPTVIVAAFERAGFTIQANLRRAPYLEVEYPSERAYIIARAGDGGDMNDQISQHIKHQT